MYIYIYIYVCVCVTRLPLTYEYLFYDTYSAGMGIDGMSLPFFNVAASVDNPTMVYMVLTVQIYCDPQSSWAEIGACGHRIIVIVLLQTDYA